MTVGVSPKNEVIGVCSLCGGDVVVPAGPWAGVKPPEAHCAKCGAVRAKPRRPVIPMEAPAPSHSAADSAGVHRVRDDQRPRFGVEPYWLASGRHG